jgi:hypothetical protein
MALYAEPQTRVSACFLVIFVCETNSQTNKETCMDVFIDFKLDPPEMEDLAQPCTM